MVGGSRTTGSRELWRAIPASVIGTALEWYDFFLYGTAAALVFPKLFFPEYDPLVGTLLSFATLSAGFVSRPLGAIIAGHFGDRHGRKQVLFVTLIVMGTATFLMGLMPSYQTIGVTAPLLMTALRFVQGLGLGGEWAGGLLMITEKSGSRKRGFFASLIQSSSPFGNVLATGVLALLEGVLSHDQFLAYGWRVAFLLSALVTLLGIYLRKRISESPLFEEVRQEDRTARVPLGEVVRDHWRGLLVTFGIRIGSDVAWYTFALFVITYITKTLGLDASVALRATLIGAGMQTVTHGITGALSDRWGRRPLSLIGVVGMAAWIVVFFPLLDTKMTGIITLAVLGGLLFHSFVYGPMAAWFAEMFPTRVRYSGAAMGYQIASLLGGSIAPVVAVALLAAYGSTVPVTIYVLVMLALALVAVIRGRETRGIDLDDVEATYRPLPVAASWPE